jgi:two-component system LytT family response regulator
MVASKIINSIIIDDEPHASGLLENILTSIAEINNLQSFQNADAALDYLAGNMDVDMIFLDIEMPGKNGFDFLGELIKFPFLPCIVFTTGFSEYAIRAVKSVACDYLLKPISADDIHKIIRRYKISFKQETLKIRYQKLIEKVNPANKLKFKNTCGVFLIHPEDIIYIQSNGNYSYIHQVGGEQELVTMQLGAIENILPADQFFRISRQAVINLRFLSKVNTKRKLCSLKFEQREIKLCASRTQAKKLKNII